MFDAIYLEENNEINLYQLFQKLKKFLNPNSSIFYIFNCIYKHFFFILLR